MSGAKPQRIDILHNMHKHMLHWLLHTVCIAWKGREKKKEAIQEQNIRKDATEKTRIQTGSK